MSEMIHTFSAQEGYMQVKPLYLIKIPLYSWKREESLLLGIFGCV